MKNKTEEITTGDLAVHSREKYGDAEKRIGLVLSINPTLGSGFRSADVMWCKSGSIETVMLNYLKSFQKL